MVSNAFDKSMKTAPVALPLSASFVVTIMDKSWDKIAFLVLFSGRQTPILVHLRNLVPIPQNPTLLPAVSSGFQHCVGWGGGIVTRFYKESSAFFKLLL